MSKLVTIITATHERPGKLARCIQSVAGQDYPCVEHVVVADGPEPRLRDLLPPSGAIRLVELGRNWHSFSERPSYGAACRLVGSMCARGDYLGYIDDDDTFEFDHVSSLVRLIEDTGADFVFSKMRKVEGGHQVSVIGHPFPRYGALGTPMVLHRPELLRVANWDPSHGYGEDWGLFQRWIDAGARYAFLDRVTVNYLD